VFSLLVNPGGWVTLCFLEGAHLPDPEKLLRGSGNRVRERAKGRGQRAKGKGEGKGERVKGIRR
jgi:hypothetical protein